MEKDGYEKQGKEYLLKLTDYLRILLSIHASNGLEIQMEFNLADSRGNLPAQTSPTAASRYY